MIAVNWGAPEPDDAFIDPDEEVVEGQFDDWDEDYENSCREEW